MTQKGGRQTDIVLIQHKQTDLQTGSNNEVKLGYTNHNADVDIKMETLYAK